MGVIVEQDMIIERLAGERVVVIFKMPFPSFITAPFSFGFSHVALGYHPSTPRLFRTYVISSNIVVWLSLFKTGWTIVSFLYRRR